MPAEHFQGRSRSRKQAKIKALKTSSEKKGGASSENPSTEGVISLANTTPQQSHQKVLLSCASQWS